MTTAQQQICLGYIRVSTDMQMKKGQSLSDQRRRLKAYCRREFGMDLPDEQIYSDPGMSGTWTVRQIPLPDARVRPELSNLVDRCMKGGVQALIIDTIDRLARDPYVCMGIQRQLEPHGTRVIVAQDNHDFSNVEDELVLTVQMGLARSEVQKMRKRATFAQAERRAAGYPPWGKVPFGWRWLTDEEFLASGEPFRGFARVEAEAEWVRWIFDQYLHRGRVILDICAELNDLRVPFRDSRIRWRAMRVRGIICNFIHAGLVRDNDGALMTGAHFDRRIIDPDIWHGVQDLRRARSTRGPRALSQRDAPLLGIARCGTCGRRLQLHRGRGDVLYYVCPRPQEGEERLCPGLTKRTDAVETVVADFVRRTANAPVLRKMIEEEASVRLREHRGALLQRRDALEAKLRNLDLRLEKMACQLTDGTISAEAFAHIDRTWRDERNAAVEELTGIESRLEAGDVEDRRVRRVMDALDTFTETWERLQATQIRQLLMSMVEDLSVEPHEDGAVTLRFKGYYMPPMCQHIPNLRGGIGGEDARIATLTITDLAFLSLWAEGKSIAEIDAARGMKPGSSYSRAHLIRQRTGLQDLDEVARLAAGRIEQYRHLLPVDCKCAEFDRKPDPEPTERQLEVARLMADGLSAKEIAERLGPTPTTIRRHLCDLRLKLGAATNKELLVLLAQQQRL